VIREDEFSQGRIAAARPATGVQIGIRPDTIGKTEPIQARFALTARF